MKILLVEDDPSTSQFLAATLTAHRYTGDVAIDGQSGLDLVARWNYDLVVLDVMIPRLDGISVCQRLRSQGVEVPILLLTAKGSSDDIVAGLDAGADDYLTKPFDLSQLLARIRALTRRKGAVPPSSVLSWGDLQLDLVTTIATYEHRELELRSREYKLLELFLRHPQRVFSRDAIIDHLWTSDDFPTEGAVTNLVKDLRQKLKRAGVPEDIIQTVYGLGYRLKAAPRCGTSLEEDHSPPAEPDAETLQKLEQVPREQERSGTAQGLSASQQEVETIAQAIQQFQVSLQKRIQFLEETEELLKKSALTPQHQKQSEAESHRLVGSLGTFGYEGSVAFARELEMLCAIEKKWQPAQILQYSNCLNALKQSIQQSTVRLPELLTAPEPRAANSIDQRAPENEDLAAADAIVIVLGDAAGLAKSVAECLQPWGIRTLPVTHEAEVWSILATVAADLILIDLDTLLFDRLEFCDAVRRSEDHGDLPIVVITAETNPAIIQQCFSAGADDFISKPVIGPELVSRVVKRIQRSQPGRASQAKQWSIRSSGAWSSPLLNRSRFIQQLDLAWQQHQQRQLPLSIILSQADQFERYREQYGDTESDVGLQEIAKVIHQFVQPFDYTLAKFGQDEFAVLLFGVDLDQVIEVIRRIQASLRRSLIAVADGSSAQPCLPQRATLHSNTSAASDRSPLHLPQLTFSFGAAGAVPAANQNPQLLLSSAEQALCAARWRGGDTYCIYGL